MLAWSGFVICLLLAVYPFAIYPLVLKCLPKVPLPGADPIGCQNFTLIIAAHNEEAALPKTLSDLRQVKQHWPALDIHCIDDGSRDATAQILAAAGAFLTVHTLPVRGGKAAALSQVISATSSDILLFMDANVRPDPAGLLRFRNYFADPDVGAVAATLQYTRNACPSIETAGSAYWRLEEAIKAAETATGSTMGCDGALWGMRRALYPVFPTHASDDFRPSMEPLFHGLRVISAADIQVYEAPTLEEVSRKRRIARGAWHAHCEMRGQFAQMCRLDRFKYVSHKLLRWFAALWLAGTCLFATLIASQSGLLVPLLQLATLAAALCLLRLGPFGRIRDILAALLATFSGTLGAMLGQKQAHWSVVRSS